MAVPDENWDVLEAWLAEAADGRKRKNGEDMVHHWLRVGRALRAAGSDGVTVCAGYGHDLAEDVRNLTDDNIAAVFEFVLGSRAAAADGVQLVHECSYTPEEYALEQAVKPIVGARQAKSMRKALACARWIAHEDPRVWAIKAKDVDDNDQSCESVPGGFAEEYRSWARPLRDGLVANQARVAALPGGPGPGLPGV